MITDQMGLPAPSQVCIVVRNLKEATFKFNKIGVGPFVFPKINYKDQTYRGKPSKGYWEMAFARWGTLELELACPVRPPSIYHDFLDVRGEGFHHFGFDIKNIDLYIEKARKLGLGILMSGRTANGGFSHLDTTDICGVIIEIIERKAPRI